MFTRALSFFSLLLTSSVAYSQIATFRMETTDLSGIPVSSLTVGDEFLFTTHAEDVRGMASGGVFAGYLDVTYDATLATVNLDREIVHGESYQHGRSGDFDTIGLMNDIGSFSSNGDELLDGNPIGCCAPIGVGENMLFTVLMRATAPGELVFTGSDAKNSPFKDVLVYNLDDPISPHDIDFGNSNVKIDFGQLAVQVKAVPEPADAGPALFCIFGLIGFRRRLR